MKKITAILMICSALAVHAEPPVPDPANTAAQENPVLDPFFAFGLTFGGDDMTSTTGRSLKAGGLLYGVVGAVYHPSPNFDIQGSFGLHLDAITADNGDTSFTRAVFELIPFYVADSGFRVGLGITRVISPEYTYANDTTNIDTHVSFDDATGVILQLDWQVLDNDWLGVRFVGVEYENDATVEPIDGGYVGVIYQLNL